MKKGNPLIILGVLLFLISLFLIQLSSVSSERPFREKQSVLKYQAPVPHPLGIVFPSLVTCGINLTGPFLNYTQGQPIVQVVDPQGYVVYSRSSFPPPSTIEFDSNVAGFYSIDFNIVFGEGGSVEMYYYIESIELVRPNEWLFLPSVLLGVIGIVISAVGAFISYRESEEDK